MLDHTLEIIADNQPTVLERILQVTRYRGFTVTGMTAYPDNENTALAIKLVVNDPKEQQAGMGGGIQRLYDQLNKLFDIKHVSLTRKSSIQNRA